MIWYNMVRFTFCIIIIYQFILLVYILHLLTNCKANLLNDTARSLNECSTSTEHIQGIHNQGIFFLFNPQFTVLSTSVLALPISMEEFLK
jgi:hypothetical protein